MNAREEPTAHVDEDAHSEEPAAERTAHTDEVAHDDSAADRAARFGHLPGRVPPEQMVEETPADPPNDPEFGRDPDNDWMVKYSA
jgi:hypothetical protein